MKKVSTECRAFYNASIFDDIEALYSIVVREDVKTFFEANNGGYPIKDIICADDTEYEVRVFLSLDKNDDNYCIEKPLKFFMSKTHARIIPIGVDSGDNYYCVNNETGKVYYWRASSDRYYMIADSLHVFVELFVE